MQSIAIEMVKILDRCGFPYMVVGALSSNLYGIPRSTKDVDMVIEIPTQRRIEDLRTELPKNFQLNPQSSFELVTGTVKYEIIVSNPKYLVELFLLSNDAHDKTRFERRIQVLIDGVMVNVPTIEDVVVTKLRWFRVKDQQDIKSIIGIQKDRLDWEYIHHWVNLHQTMKELSKLLSETE